MTTKELRAYIDRTLGNSIRCLLPSYWWKRLFGAVVDKVEAVDTNVTGVSNRVNSISTKVNDLSEQMSGIDVSAAKIVVVEWDGMESSTTANNKEAYTLIRHCLENNKPVAVVVWNTIQGLANTHHVAKSFNIRNELNGTVAVWIRFIFEGTESHSQFLIFKLTEDGTLKLNKSENIYDDFISETSTNAVQNKVVTAELAKKQDVLVSSETIKTINGQSILGEGNITIEGGEGSYDDTEIQNKLTELNAAKLEGKKVILLDPTEDVPVGDIAEIKAQLTELSEETENIKKELYGKKETLVGEIKQNFNNTLAYLKLDGNTEYSIKLSFAAGVTSVIYPRLFTLGGQQLTTGAMGAGLTEFVIEYIPSEDMEVELRVNIMNDNPNLVGTQCQIIIESKATYATKTYVDDAIAAEIDNALTEEY